MSRRRYSDRNTGGGISEARQTNSFVAGTASGTQATTIPNTTSSEIRIRPQGTTNRNDVAQLNVAWDAIPDMLTLKFGPDYK